MRPLCNFLSDPTLHLLAIALFLIYLTFGGGLRWRDSFAESPLPICKVCHTHFLPDRPCECHLPKKIARVAH
jgi:hypothetical protein